MNTQDELERILQSRFVPQMRSNLPERIIAASLSVEKKKSGVFLNWLSDFLDGFALPRPALAMALALVIGVYIGMSPESNAKSDYDFFTQTQVQADLGDML